MQKPKPPEPILLIRACKDMLWAWPYTNKSQDERKRLFGAVAKATKNDDIKRACKILIKYDRDELAKMMRGSYLNLKLCFRWAWCQEYSRVRMRKLRAELRVQKQSATLHTR